MRRQRQGIIYCCHYGRRAVALTAVRRVHPPFLCSHGCAQLHVAGIFVQRVGSCMQSTVHMLMPLQNDVMIGSASYCNCRPPYKKTRRDNGQRRLVHSYHE